MDEILEEHAVSIIRIECRMMRNVVSQKGGWGRGEIALSRSIGTMPQHCERCPFCSNGKISWIVNSQNYERREGDKYSQSIGTATRNLSQNI
jgi:hypothetical protein